MKKFLKVLVPVLVLAMLLQVPFAMSASASTLSQGTSYNFSLAPSSDPTKGNVEAKLSMTTDENELITTVGATLVVKESAFDLVNSSGEVVTDSYKVDSKQVGTDLSITSTQVGEDAEDVFTYQSFCSLVSYNAANEEFYIFISGLNAGGLNVAANSEIFTFYLQAKDGVKPSEDNVRVMALSEYKTTCASYAIAPGYVGSKSTPIGTGTDDIVTAVTVDFNFPSAGSVSGAITSDNKGIYAVDVTVTLANEANTYTTTTKAEEGYAFSAVEAGTYTITITAPGSLGYTIYNVVVVPETETAVPSIYLMFGDVDDSGSIAPKDVSDLLTVYGNTLEASDINNVDGDNVIGPADLSIMLLASHYGADSTSQVLDLLA